MPGIVQLQNRNPWAQQLPGFLQNIIFNQMAAKRQDEQFKAQTIAAQGKEVRGYQAKGWRETGARAGAIKIGDKYYAPPERGVEYVTKKIGGKQVLVPTETMTPVGGTPQYVKSGTPIASEQKPPGTAMAAFLRQNRNATPQQISAFQQTLHKPNKFSLKMGPDGKLMSVSYGDVGEVSPVGELSRGAKGQFQKEMESATGHYQQLERAMTMFKPQHHRWLNQGLHLLTRIKEKGQGLIPGVKVSPKEKEEFAEYTRYKKSLTSSYAQRVHELGKGTLTKHETKIYGGALAQPGMSETEIIETAKENMVELQMSIARKRYYLTAPEYGATEEERLKNFHKMRRGAEIMPVSGFEQMIDARYARELSRLRAQDQQAPYEQLKQRAKEMIKATFFGF